MRKPIPISELLALGKAKLEHLKKGSEAAERVLAAVQRALPPDLAPHVWAASVTEAGLLTVVAENGGWASRVRYVMPEITRAVETALGRDLARARVQVRPRPEPPPGRAPD